MKRFPKQQIVNMLMEKKYHFKVGDKVIHEDTNQVCVIRNYSECSIGSVVVKDLFTNYFGRRDCDRLRLATQEDIEKYRQVVVAQKILEEN